MTEIEVVNPLHKLYSVISGLLETVPDINEERANYSDPKARQWIFPSYPEKIDENFPRISLEFGSAQTIEYGSAQYVQSVENAGLIQKDQYGEYIEIPLTIHCHIKKDQMHEVSYFDGTNHFIKNQKQGDFLSFLIANKIRTSRRILIENGFDLSNKPTITPSYSDNEFLFSADVSFNLIFLSVWNQEYSSGDLIKTINSAYTVEQTGDEN